MYSSILSILLFLEGRPMLHNSLNYIEIANEFFLLLTSYFMLIFSGWVQDVEGRYEAGFGFMFLLALILAINLAFIVRELCN